MGWKIKPGSLVHIEVGGVQDVLGEVENWREERLVYVVRLVGSEQRFERDRQAVRRVIFSPKQLSCVACGEAFEFPVGEQVYFRKHQLFDPSRCKICRAQRKQGEPAEPAPG